MKPTWTSDCGRVTLYLGDCNEIVPVIKPVGVDLVATDPPYGIKHPCNYGERGRSGLAKCNDYPYVEGDDEPFDPALILSLGLPVILWGGNHYASRLPDSGGWLVWDKERPDDLDQATCELAWTNFVKGVRRYKHLWNGCMRATEKGLNFHPMQKPVALMEWCLSLRWCSGFNTVFDPYMGCGPVGVACVKTGRKYIGIELEPRYFEIAKRRIKEELEANLFAQGGR